MARKGIQRQQFPKSNESAVRDVRNSIAVDSAVQKNQLQIEKLLKSKSSINHKE
jgi:hypothetical protein